MCWNLAVLLVNSQLETKATNINQALVVDNNNKDILEADAHGTLTTDTSCFKY